MTAAVLSPEWVAELSELREGVEVSIALAHATRDSAERIGRLVDLAVALYRVELDALEGHPQ